MDTGFLLDVLACPQCHGQLELVGNKVGKTGFACNNCAVVYPVENEIPVMLVERAIPITEFEKYDGER